LELAMNNSGKALLLAASIVCGPVLVTTTDASLPTARPLHLAQIQAQSQKDEPVVSSERTINLTEENRYIIREIVLKDPNVPKQTGAKAVIGDPAPAGIATQPFPVEVTGKVPALRSQRFFVADGAVVVVDPKTNKVADIVKQAQ
jgi:hypothetical protein